MDLQLTGKRALITGGSKRIGRASAAVFAEEGCDLVLLARDPATLGDAAAGSVASRCGSRPSRPTSRNRPNRAGRRSRRRDRLPFITSQNGAEARRPCGLGPRRPRHVDGS